MSRTQRLTLVPIALALLPLAALAAAKAREEFRDAVSRTPDFERGAQLYRETCTACHGADGAGVADGSVPAIAGQHRRVLVKQLVDFRNRRRWDIRMEHFADRKHLPQAQDLADLAGHVNRLPAQPTRAFGGGEHLRQGASVYFSACESCHGPIGEGDDGELVPRLAGQHVDYLVRQMQDTADGRRPNMTETHAAIVRELDRQQILGVADYLSRMNPPARL
jgi:cytochrome c553